MVSRGVANDAACCLFIAEVQDSIEGTSGLEGTDLLKIFALEED